jgi:hypothetical protein
MDASENNIPGCVNGLLLRVLFTPPHALRARGHEYVILTNKVYVLLCMAISNAKLIDVYYIF